MNTNSKGLNSLLANNLLFLRTRKKVSQSEVARAVKVTADSISKYEKGDREPRKDKLTLLAQYFEVSAEALTNHEITEEFLIERSKKIAEEKLLFFSENILVKMTSDSARANSKFSKAWDHLEQTIYSPNPMETRIQESKRLFLETLKNDNLLEGAVNTLFVIFYEYILKIKSESIQQKITDEKLKYDDLYIDLEEYEVNRLSIIDKFILDNETIINDCIKALKCNFETADIADYYIALKYLINLTINDNSFETNSKIGGFMMLELSKYDNKYALNIVASILDLMQLI